MSFDGILLVDKPAGISSFGVVAKVRRIITGLSGERVKVGHTGTLDPAATGLLVLVIGGYCKKAQQFSNLGKIYQVEITLGAASTTGDQEGEKHKVSTRKPSEKEISEVLNKFVGPINQTPPAYSAVKVQGQRAYKLARRGEKVELKPRRVTICAISDVEYNYPKVCFLASVSSGTYIRSLAEDIGKVLGVGAYLSFLRRTAVGGFEIGRAIQLSDAEQKLPDAITKD